MVILKLLVGRHVQNLLGTPGCSFLNKKCHTCFIVLVSSRKLTEEWVKQPSKNIFRPPLHKEWRNVIWTCSLLSTQFPVFIISIILWFKNCFWPGIFCLVERTQEMFAQVVVFVHSAVHQCFLASLNGLFYHHQQQHSNYRELYAFWSISVWEDVSYLHFN